MAVRLRVVIRQPKLPLNSLVSLRPRELLAAKKESRSMFVTCTQSSAMNLQLVDHS